MIAGMVLVLRQGARRIRRDHHLRLQHSGRDADDFGGDLHLHQGPRRRRRGRPAGARRHRDLAGRADRLRMVRAARRHRASTGNDDAARSTSKNASATSRSQLRSRAPGGVTALFGPSGAGKTSLVNMIAGLLPPDRGRIALDDAVLFDSQTRINVPAHRRRIGYVFQDGRLFPHLSVAAQSRLRPAHERPAARPGRNGAHRRPARHRPSARPPARQALRRRAPARRDRPRAADAAAPAAARRAARLARRGAQARDPALSRAAARRSQRADGLCQPPRRRNAAHRHAVVRIDAGRVLAVGGLDLLDAERREMAGTTKLR